MSELFEEDVIEMDFSIDELVLDESNPHQINNEFTHRIRNPPHPHNQPEEEQEPMEEAVAMQEEDEESYQQQQPARRFSKRNRKKTSKFSESLYPRQQIDQQYVPSEQSYNINSDKNERSKRSRDRDQLKNNLKRISRASLNIIDERGCLTRDELLSQLIALSNGKDRQKIKRRNYDALNVMQSMRLLYISKRQQKRSILYSRQAFKRLPKQEQQKILYQQENKKTRTRKKANNSMLDLETKRQIYEEQSDIKKIFQRERSRQKKPNRSIQDKRQTIKLLQLSQIEEFKRNSQLQNYKLLIANKKKKIKEMQKMKKDHKSMMNGLIEIIDKNRKLMERDLMESSIPETQTVRISPCFHIFTPELQRLQVQDPSEVHIISKQPQLKSDLQIIKELSQLKQENTKQASIVKLENEKRKMLRFPSLDDPNIFEQ